MNTISEASFDKGSIFVGLSGSSLQRDKVVISEADVQSVLNEHDRRAMAETHAIYTRAKQSMERLLVAAQRYSAEVKECAEIIHAINKLRQDE